MEKKDEIASLRERFLSLAEKVGVTPENIIKIKEDFDKSGPEATTKQIDIAQNPEDRLPTSEEIDNMEKEQLIAFAKKMIRKPEPEKTPFVVMMKNKGYIS